MNSASDFSKSTLVTVVRFSQITDRPSEIESRLSPGAPLQN